MSSHRRVNTLHTRIILVLGVLLLAGTTPLLAQQANLSPDSVGITLSLDGGNFTKAVNVFLLMTVLSLVPAFVMMMTSFTRIVIVLGFLKQAMGTQQAPSGKTMSGLALFLTFFIMQPVWEQIYEQAIVPFSDNQITQETAINRGIEPLKTFMLRQTREECLQLFMDLGRLEPVPGPEYLPMRVVVPAFMISELKTAFQMGFLIYLPFLVLDAVAATILMSMGMMMLPPVMISMPFKILLFIIVDGWDLLIRALVSSFM